MEKIALLLSDFYFRAPGITISAISNVWQHLWLRKPGGVPALLLAQDCIAWQKDETPHDNLWKHKSGNVKNRNQFHLTFKYYKKKKSMSYIF